MLRNYGSAAPDVQMDSQNPTYTHTPNPNLFSNNEYSEDKYSTCNELPHSSSQSSLFNSNNGPSKKGLVLDDITNILNHNNQDRVEFPNVLETSNSKGQSSNQLMNKFFAEKLSHMDIEDNGPISIHSVNDLDKLECNGYRSTMSNGLIQTTDGWRKNKNRNFVSSSQEYLRPKPKNPSLIKRWKKSDKVFQGKYSTGTTPRWAKNNLANLDSLSLIPFKRSNTDVPPTFEADKILMTEKSEIGANKYINNLLGTTDAAKPPLNFTGTNTLLKKPLPKALGLNLKSKAVQNLSGPKLSVGSKPKLLRDFPLDLTKNAPLFGLNPKPEPGLFLIPEKNSEYDLLPSLESLDATNNSAKNKEFKKPKADLVTKFLNFEEEDGKEDEDLNVNVDLMDDLGEIKQQDEDEEMGSPFLKRSSPKGRDSMSPELKKDFHTPPKGDTPPREEKTNFFDTITAKKQPQSKLFSKPDHKTISPFEPTANKTGFEDSMSETEVFGQPNRSRFEQDYEVLEVLGSGYFGTVYKCQNRLDGLIYAIKCTRNKLKGQNNISQALNEAQALASLSALDDNPFIVRYYSAWIEDDRLYLAMEHCQSNLKALRRQHIRFSESMIRQIMRDICMGLKHLHNQKIVHLDIKPENILYSKTRKYKIADLGLSRIAQRSNHEDINEGDCRYLAPELLRDYPDNQLPDLTKADIFSFGATIYELLIGTDLPKNGAEWANLRDGNLMKLDQLNYSNSLKSMLRSMMSNNPDFRPSAHELLTNFLQSEIELELKWEKRQNKILKDRIKELEQKLHSKRKNSV